MKIRVIELEATAQELKASNTVADGVLTILRNVFNGIDSECEDDEDLETEHADQ